MTKNTRQDLTAAVALAALFFATLFLAIGCANTPAAPTPGAVALDVPVGSPMMVAESAAGSA